MKSLINRKRIIALTCLLILLLTFVSCGILEDKVAVSVGEHEKREFFTSGGFQDYTNYGKYYYKHAYVEQSSYLKKIQETDLAIINTHLDDFEGWIETIQRSESTSEVVVNYDFDRGIIDTEDYIYIDSEERTWTDGYTSLVNYDVYFFDTQTKVLYYFHNNI